MMETTSTEPCKICGCTQVNLIDGFYYCIECGTQDTNVRETLVEFASLGEGVVAIGARKRVTLVPEQKKAEMTDDWYKWHSLNFLLQGLANELIECGAAPTFKTKLLWLWMRYMKKYQNKADFGLEENIDQENVEEENPKMKEKELSFDEDDEEEEEIRKKYNHYYKYTITKMNMCLVMSFLYVALNLDKSHIQLSHLIRFIKEGRISIMHWQKHVPQELRPKRLSYCLLFHKTWLRYSYTAVRFLGMQMFRELNLGSPIVPDLRLLIDEIMQELCLPNDMKPLVCSLMHYRSFDYLNVHIHGKKYMPSYELYVISHILCALKICFGLDGVYESKLSDAVDKINEMENHPKSYYSEPTERLFSFREWFSYLQFRKSQLWSHTLHCGASNYHDMNDYVAFEHLSDKPDYKITLKDRIARDIINKLPECDINVIPIDEFPASTTPYTTYNRVIIEHTQDPIVKKLLSEDFTQYSLKYIMEDMFLVDPDSDCPNNILTGVSEHNLIRGFRKFRLVEHEQENTYSQKMVYVKDCDNHNWMTTNRPQEEHIIRSRKGDSSKENDPEGDMENETDSKDHSVMTVNINVTNGFTHLSDVTINSNTNDKGYESDSKETGVITDDNKVFNLDETDIDLNNDKEKLNDHNDLKIREETEGTNIFDDVFEDTKKETEEELQNDEAEMLEPENDTLNLSNTFRYDNLTQEYRAGRDSDESSDDSIHITPETLDRNKAIKELVIHACNKYKVSLPGKYICRPKPKYVRRKKYEPNVERAKVKGLIKELIKGLITDYHTQIHQDLFLQMSTVVQSAIADFNQNRPDENAMEIDEPLSDNVNENFNHNDTENDAAPDTETRVDLDETADDDQYKLFDDESEGETHAEDVLPKKNPEFDEKTHDITQLYIKPPEDAGIAEMKLNPKLFKIIDQKIKEEQEDKPPSSPEVKEQIDSEDEMPLSAIQELQKIRYQYKTQKKHAAVKVPLLTPAMIPTSYNYWVRHYLRLNSFVKYKSFANEMEKVFPDSFITLLKECADIVGYPPYNIYKSLQRVETCISDKYVLKKRFNPSYLESVPKRFKNARGTY